MSEKEMYGITVICKSLIKMSPTSFSQLTISPKKIPTATPSTRPIMTCPDRLSRRFSIRWTVMFSPHIPKRRRLFHIAEDYRGWTEIDTSTCARALLASDDAPPKVAKAGELVCPLCLNRPLHSALVRWWHWQRYQCWPAFVISPCASITVQGSSKIRVLEPPWRGPLQPLVFLAPTYYCTSLNELQQ